MSHCIHALADTQNVFIVEDRNDLYELLKVTYSLSDTYAAYKTETHHNFIRQTVIIMDNTGIKVSYLASDNDFYTNVFKKTERIVSVILYIVSETKPSHATALFHEKLKDKSVAALEAALAALALQPPAHEHGLFAVQHALVAVGSALQLAETARVVSAPVAQLIMSELDAVQRYLKHHYLSGSGVSLQSDAAVSPGSAAGTASRQVGSPRSASPRPVARPAAPRAMSRSQIPPGDISTDAYLVYSQLTDRSERIKTVLSAKPDATIKDIAEVITDVSEKTIQRELNSLIEKGQVIRQGERRWSKYSLPSN